MKQTSSRRSFLKTGGIVLGAGVATCCGLTTLAVQAPTIPLTETHYGDTNKPSKILIVYATRCGSTIGVAERIAKTMSQTGASVDVLPVKNIADANVLQMYQAVIVGSAIRRGSWLPEASNFVKQYQDVLVKTSLAYFSVCMTLEPDTPENRQQAGAYLDPVRAILKPQAEVFFAGKYDPDQVSFVDRLMLQTKGTPVGDFRNWSAIEDWAATLS
jgi:menaquinone-dependent protoporphyrinogen oxidase